jgi:hypothetical protein
MGVMMIMMGGAVTYARDAFFLLRGLGASLPASAPVSLAGRGGAGAGAVIPGDGAGAGAGAGCCESGNRGCDCAECRPIAGSPIASSILGRGWQTPCSRLWLSISRTD